jgi:hypothetical protein
MLTGFRTVGSERTDMEAPFSPSEAAILTATVRLLPTVELPVITTGVAGQPVVPEETIQTVPVAA